MLLLLLLLLCILLYYDIYLSTNEWIVLCSHQRQQQQFFFLLLNSYFNLFSLWFHKIEYRKKTDPELIRWWKWMKKKLQHVTCWQSTNPSIDFFFSFLHSNGTMTFEGEKSGVKGEEVILDQREKKNLIFTIKILMLNTKFFFPFNSIKWTYRKRRSPAGNHSFIDSFHSFLITLKLRL